VRNITIDRFFADTLDDVADVMTQAPILAFLGELRKKVEDMILEVEEIRNDLILRKAQKYLSQ
jgi:uncharacterized protein YqgQ